MGENHRSVPLERDSLFLLCVRVTSAVSLVSLVSLVFLVALVFLVSADQQTASFFFLMLGADQHVFQKSSALLAVTQPKTTKPLCRLTKGFFILSKGSGHCHGDGTFHSLFEQVAAVFIHSLDGAGCVICVGRTAAGAIQSGPAVTAFRSCIDVA